MKMAKVLMAFVAAALIAMAPSALAASNNYYAQTMVLFNVPSDATFSIAMPANYGSWTQITSTSDYPSATATDWISFNFTASPQAALQEPYQLGVSGNTQALAASPIYYIDNTGNTNEQFDIKINETMPSNINLWYNATCTGTCGTVTATLTAVGTGYTSLATAVTTSSYLNVTLFANTSAGVTTGISARYIAIRSTAV